MVVLRLLWGLGLVLSGAALAQAQPAIEARFAAVNGAPLVGEPVELVLTAVLPGGAAIVSWPDFPSQWPPFEVRHTDEVRAIERPDGSLEMSQRIVAVLWYPGEQRTPDTRVVVQVAGGPPIEVIVTPVFFFVPSVLQSQELVLRDFRPPVDMTYLAPALVAAGIGVLGLVAAMTFAFVRRRTRVVSSTTAVSMSMVDKVLAKLAQIGVRGGGDVQMYLEVSECLRGYVGVRFELPAEDMTASEIVIAMADRIPAEQQGELGRLLEQADLVKFARYRPGPRNAQLYVDLASRWVKRVEYELNGKGRETAAV